MMERQFDYIPDKYSGNYLKEIEIISVVTEGLTDGIRIMMIKSNH